MWRPLQLAPVAARAGMFTSVAWRAHAERSCARCVGMPIEKSHAARRSGRPLDVMPGCAELTITALSSAADDNRGRSILPLKHAAGRTFESLPEFQAPNINGPDAGTALERTAVTDSCGWSIDTPG